MVKKGSPINEQLYDLNEILTPLLGPVELRADCSGWGVWEKIARNTKFNMGTEPNRQFRQGPWAIHLNGGKQDWGGGWDDFASAWIHIDEIPLPDLMEILATYYKFLAGTAEVGVAAPNIAIRTHHKDDHDRRAEITDTGVGVVTEGWHEIVFNPAATAVLYYGAASVVAASDLAEETNYTWAQFQADVEFKEHTVYQINIDYGYWGGNRSTGDVWIGSCRINGRYVKWEPTDLNNLGTRPTLTGNPFGEPTLAARGNGTAVWDFKESSPHSQKGGSAWKAKLNGGVQDGWNDWAAMHVAVNELPIPLFNTARWSWYNTELESFGLNLVIWVHHPFDFDKRAEITQLASVAGLEKDAGWLAHELNQTTDQFFYFGEGVADTSLITGDGPGTLFGWDDFQGDRCFNGWTVYRVSLEWGWQTGGEEFKDLWIAEATFNEIGVPIVPGFTEQLLRLEEIVTTIETESATIVLALKQALEASIDVGDATGGSNTTLVDTAKSWETDMWKGATFDVEIASKGYLGLVISNTATTLTFAALAGAAAVVSGCPYSIKRLVSVSDIGMWGGTDLTGRDISLDLKALTDDGIKGLLKTLGDIGAGSNIISLIATLDAVIDLIKAKTDNIDQSLTTMESNLRGASSKDLTTLETAIAAVGTLVTTLDAVVDLIKAKTDNIDQSLTTTESNLRGASSKDLTTIETAIAAVGTLVTTLDAVVDLIKAKTDNVDQSIATTESNIRGASSKDLTTIEAAIDAVATAVALLETISVEANDITAWGGTALTGRDISLDLKALVDDGIKGLLKSVGDIGAGSPIITLIATMDAQIDLIKAKTDNLDQALTTMESDLRGASSKDLTTLETAVAAVGTLVTTLDAVVDLIKAKTDNLDQGIAATESNLRGASSKDLTTLETAITAVGTLVTTLDAVVDLIKAKTDNLDQALSTTESNLRGASSKDLTTLEVAVAAVEADVAALLTGTILAAGTNIIGSVKDEFGGNAYSKTMTMGDDNATRFEAAEKKLRDCVIIVETHPMLLGETGVEVYPVAANDRVGFTKIDVSTLYFKNAGAGNNGKITILGVEE